MYLKILLAGHRKNKPTYYMASSVSGQEPIQIAWKISHLRVKHLIGFVRETLSSSAMLSHYYQHPVIKALVNDVSATICPRLPGPLAQETSWATMCPQQCVLVYKGLYRQLLNSHTCFTRTPGTYHERPLITCSLFEGHVPNMDTRLSRTFL